MSVVLMLLSIIVWHGRTTAAQRYAERDPLPMDTQPYEDYYDEYETESFNLEDYMHIHRWNIEEFPHPQKDFLQCNRMKPSFICDPDKILDKEQVDKLESSIEELYKSTPCICDQCSEGDGGIIIGIALLKNVFQPYNEHYIQTIRNFAERTRERWKLGKCDNDILIVVATTDRLFYTDVGKATSAYVTLKEAYRIFQENKAHLSLGHFYEGLNGIFGEYYRMTKDMKAPEPQKLNVALISGSIVGSVLLLAVILLIAIIICRRYKKRKSEEKPDETSGRKPEGVSSSWTKQDIKVMFGSLKVNETPVQAKYQACRTEETDAPLSSFRIDEEDEVIDTTLATSEQMTSIESNNLDKELATAVEGLTQTFKPKTFRRSETNC